MSVSSPNRKEARSLVSRSGDGSLNFSSPASISAFCLAAVANCFRPLRPRRSLDFSMSASISSFLRETTSCCACRALPRRPRLVEAIGEPGVGPGGVVSGVCFGEEVWRPVVCLLLLTFVACQPWAGGYLMAPEHQIDSAALAVFERWSAFVTSSSAAAALASRTRLL